MTGLGLLFLSIILGACQSSPRLTGTELKERLRLSLNDSIPVDFSADPVEAVNLCREILSEKPAAPTGQETLWVDGADGKKRALGLHVPADYTPGRPWPLVVWLHGGVNGTRPDRGAEVAHYFARESDSLGFLFAAPSGERGATWFDPVGRDNIRLSLQAIKKKYRVDDNRVVLAGVSDGGTGCYLSGMPTPDPFAGYAVFSASPLLLPALGIALLPVNMRLRPWRVVHGGRDDHYPAADIQKAAAYFASLGTDITFHLYDTAGHGLDYMPQERPSTLEFFLKVRRDPCPRRIEFECAGPFQLSWLSADSVTAAPGRTAYARGECTGDTLLLTLRGIRRFSLTPAAPVFHPGQNLYVKINGRPALQKTLRPDLRWAVDRARKSQDGSFLPFCRLELLADD